jgi:DNA-binding MarR family transcriptional regulator
MEENCKNIFPYMIFVTVRALMKQTNALFANHNIAITIDQLLVLNVIADTPIGNSQQNMADVLDKDKSAVVRTIDILVKKKFVQRLTNPTDRRENIIQITPEGENIRQLANKIDNAHIEKITQQFNKEDYEGFKKILQQIRETNL